MVVLKRAFSDLKYSDGGLGLAEFFCSSYLLLEQIYGLNGLTMR